MPTDPMNNYHFDQLVREDLENAFRFHIDEIISDDNHKENTINTFSDHIKLNRSLIQRGPRLYPAQKLGFSIMHKH